MTGNPDATESFLSRWSRLKRGGPAPVETPPAPQAAPPAPAVQEAETPPAGEEEAGTQPPAQPPELPPVDSLKADSDFTPFLRADVPEDLHRQALRRLWTSDPIYANDDGLKDYADDYTGLFSGSGAVRTLYRVGKGFVDAAEEAAERAEAEAAAAREPADDGNRKSCNSAENTEEPPPTDMRTGA